MQIQLCPNPTESQARQVTEVYEACYGTGGAAMQQYPFPQFLDANWIRKEKHHDLIRFVAVQNDRVVGTVAGRTNIGGSAGGVAEVYGLAVLPEARGQGLGSTLFGRVSETLADDDEVLVLAETRAIPGGGSGIVRRHHYVPLGITPLAHFMPNGFESMTMFGRLASKAWHPNHRAAPVSQRVRRLAEQVLVDSQLPAPPVQPAQAGTSRPAPTGRRSDQPGPRNGEGVDVRVVHLNRLQGQMPNRYAERTLQLGTRGWLMGQARIRIDRVDERATILWLLANEPAAVPAVARELVRKAPQLAQRELKICSVEISLDDLAAQEALESVGFTPTVYYPGMIPCPDRRLDCVRYEYIYHPEIVPGSLRSLKLVGYEAMARLLENDAYAARAADSTRRVRLGS